MWNCCWTTLGNAILQRQHGKTRDIVFTGQAFADSGGGHQAWQCWQAGCFCLFHRSVVIALITVLLMRSQSLNIYTLPFILIGMLSVRGISYAYSGRLAAFFVCCSPPAAGGSQIPADSPGAGAPRDGFRKGALLSLGGAFVPVRWDDHGGGFADPVGVHICLLVVFPTSSAKELTYRQKFPRDGNGFFYYCIALRWWPTRRSAPSRVACNRFPHRVGDRVTAWGHTEGGLVGIICGFLIMLMTYDTPISRNFGKLRGDFRAVSR